MSAAARNERQGKFTQSEAEAVFNSLPWYMADVARFIYEAEHRSGEVRHLRWSIWNLMLFAFRFNHESRRARQIVLTEELEEILSRRKADRHPGCDRYSITTGIPWIDYRKCWRSAGVTLGFGAYYCRDCRTITPTFDGDTWCPVDRCT